MAPEAVRRSALPDALSSLPELTALIRARQALVCLDFDGTLADIVDDPAAAAPVAGACDVVQALAARCPVAILSGRDLADIRSRFTVPGIWYAGCHGVQLVGPDGVVHTTDEALDALPAIESATAHLCAALHDIPGIRIEPKRFAVAVHYRNVAAQTVSTILAEVQRRASEDGLCVTYGRKVIELRPDIHWDKGTALAWIRDRTHRTDHTVAFYLGDDVTDEDAFEAVRLAGVGIAVRHPEDGDGVTAARFTLDGPEHVVEFLRLYTARLALEQAAARSAWTYDFTGYDPASEKLREALCTVGNGYFATRGAAPESKAGTVHYPGTYAAGIYNRLQDLVAGTTVENESLVNLPNWLGLTFRIDGGAWFDVDAVSLLGYRQTLDLKNAVLTRELRFRDVAGRTTSVTQRRFVAMHLPHIAALQTTIVPEDWSGRLEIRSTLDAGVDNSLVARYRDLSGTHVRLLDKHALSDDSVSVTVQTTQSRIVAAMASRTAVFQDGKAASAAYRLVDEGLEIGHHIAVDAAAGVPMSVEKTVALVTGRDAATSEPADAAERRLGRQPRFGDILGAHTLQWAHLWERLAIDIDIDIDSDIDSDSGGYADELRILRLHLVHLLQTVSHHSDDLDVGVPARGLSGEAYRGHVFWDELFIFPVLNLRMPMITRSQLRYRYRRLQEARRAAHLAGYAGAMFPWQSGSDGREESQRMHLNPRSGRWHPDASGLAHHIGIAVAYNAWQFYQATGDLAYLIDYGAELLVEIARFWVSRAIWDTDRRRYGIRGVIGPDEFHSGYSHDRYGGVDNNAYTNVMAVWTILRAVDAVEAIPLPNRLDLCEKLSLSTVELEQWDRISRRMYVPFHEGIITQFDGYENLRELDWAAYRRRYGDIARLDRILEAEGDDVNRYKVSKQADVLMLLFLLSSDELRALLTRLGYSLDPERIPVMVDYYLARTSHGSTLSAVVNTWVSARANRERAVDFFRDVLASDVADIQGGTTAEGIHLAAMAGSVDLMQRCFSGLELRDDRLVFAPNWPTSLGALRFPLHYRGHHLHVELSGRGAEITADPRDVPSVLVECRGQVHRLGAGDTIRFF